MNARKQKLRRKFVVPARERGSSLVEMMIAATVLLVGIVPLAGVFTVALSQNSGYVDVANRTAFNAQDKMEQLMALSYFDNSSDTTVYPTATAGGNGLGGTMAGNSTVGSVVPCCDVGEG